MRLTGATRLYAIVGDPIAQVRSPEVFAEQFAANGMDAILVPAHVPAARFDEIVPALMALGNLDGLIATVPFKARMVRYAHLLGETAKHLGAVNALRKEPDGSWTGDMFDGLGLVNAIERKGGSVRDRRVLLFGAGGAGSAIAYTLAARGTASLDIVDPDAGRASALVERLRSRFPMLAIGTATAKRSEVDMVVNASTVGMKPGDGLPGEIGPLASGNLVGDVIGSPKPTALIEYAMRSGCTWADGRDMVAGQVSALIAFFASTSHNAPAAAAATNREG